MHNPSPEAIHSEFALPRALVLQQVKRAGASRPRISARNSANARGSRAGTMV
jgi:hypothetical protein